MNAYGAIEAGGTKFVCAVGGGPNDVYAKAHFPTTTPDETLAQAVAFFEQHHRHTPLTALGIGAFGPLALDPSAPRYGQITSTPKPGWAHTDMLAPFKQALGIPIVIDTDVNTAALGEWRWGAGQGCDPLIYITVGTGIGGGGVCNGRLMHGLIHPEMGHLRLPRDLEADPFEGSCPFHGDCWEGLASGPAIAARWGKPGEHLPDGHPAWVLEAHYVALGLVNVICTLSPQKIVLGGGVMRPHLFPRVRKEVVRLLNGYVDHPALVDDPKSFIVPPALGQQAGVLGALALARQH